MIPASQIQTRALDADAFPRTCQTVEKALRDETAPAIVAGFWDAHEPDLFWTSGWGKTRLEDSRPVSARTEFDLASLTKAIGTSLLAATLVERSWIGWNSPIKAFLPHFPSGDVTIAHLLSHSAGYPAWKPFYEKMIEFYEPTPLWRIPIRERQERMRQLVLDCPLENEPGKTWVYSDLSFLVLGFLLEEATRMPLDEAITSLVWRPRGMNETHFVRVNRSLKASRQVDVAATEDSAWRLGVLQGQVFDDNCWAMGGYGGHAGAFGTVGDLLHLVRSLFDRTLSFPVLSRIWSRVPEPAGCPRTLGWDTPTPGGSTGKYFSERSVGHLGFTGTSLWVDLEKAVAVVLLTNRVHPSRDNLKIRQFRPEFHDAVMEDYRERTS